MRIILLLACLGCAGCFSLLGQAPEAAPVYAPVPQAKSKPVVEQHPVTGILVEAPQAAVPAGPPGVTIDVFSAIAEGDMWTVSLTYTVRGPPPDCVWYLEQPGPNLTLRWLAIPVKLQGQGTLRKTVAGFQAGVPLDTYLATSTPGTGPGTLDGRRYTPLTATVQFTPMAPPGKP